MRKLKDFDTEYDRFRELIKYAKSLNNFFECRYEKIISAYTDGMML